MVEKSPHNLFSWGYEVDFRVENGPERGIFFPKKLEKAHLLITPIRPAPRRPILHHNLPLTTAPRYAHLLAAKKAAAAAAASPTPEAPADTPTEAPTDTAEPSPPLDAKAALKAKYDTIRPKKNASFQQNTTAT